MNIDIIAKDCCGCRSCEQSCPKKCISMQENEAGFIYPKIDYDQCINCGICLNKCPIHTYKNNEIIPKVYAFRSKSSSILNSTSGGACDIVSKKIISNGGVIYGVAFDDDFSAKYIRVTDINDLIKIQSSKYLFADTNQSYSSVKVDLENGKEVLFTGTSCQVDGLLKFLNRTYDNLFTISLICHGVPSPKLFKEYIRYKENKLNSKIVKYNFRSKDKHGWSLTECIECENGKKYYENLFYTSYGYDFEKGLNYRENCYSCKYCNLNRVGDWSVGDFWGIENIHPKFFDKKGNSVVLVMSEKGEKMLNSLSDSIDLLESTIHNAQLRQENLKNPTKRNTIRDTYYEEFSNNPNFFADRTPKKNHVYWMKKMCPRWLTKLLRKILKK